MPSGSSEVGGDALGHQDVDGAVAAVAAVRGSRSPSLPPPPWSLPRATRRRSTRTDLSGAALPVTGRRRSTLPQGISPADARALLKSCDRRTPVGRRDFAVILILLRLGIRACEVAGLQLDDIDWRAGQLTVHGKRGRVDQLPLPVDVGEAIAAYLRHDRRRTDRREVFLKVTAPVTGLRRRVVSLIVRRACARAGLDPCGSHRLRHSLACDMVRAGVPLQEIGQVLRHGDAASTSIYANPRKLHQMGDPNRDFRQSAA